jgi:hypothetical protein
LAMFFSQAQPSSWLLASHAFVLFSPSKR